MSSWAQSWQHAETTLFGWFRSILGGDLDKSAFLGEIPVDFEYESERGMWVFALTGGGVPLDYDSNIATAGGFGVRQLSALWEGYYTERKDAMSIAGKMMDAIPLPEGSLAGVYRCKPAQEPSIERGVLTRANDQTDGGEMRVWKVTIALEVMLQRVEAP